LSGLPGSPLGTVQIASYYADKTQIGIDRTRMSRQN